MIATDSLDNTIARIFGFILGLTPINLWIHNLTSPLDESGPYFYTGPEGLRGNADIGGGSSVPMRVDPTTLAGGWDPKHYRGELMSAGNVRSGVEPISLLSAGALADLGYQVDRTAADDFVVAAASGGSRRELSNNWHLSSDVESVEFLPPSHHEEEVSKFLTSDW